MDLFSSLLDIYLKRTKEYIRVVFLAISYALREGWTMHGKVTEQIHLNSEHEHTVHRGALQKD